jgi:Na+/H+ antiporter NhaD/arsenite permease-like protein
MSAFWITLSIVVITYLGIAIGRWPILKANRTTIALMGVGLLLVTRQLRFEQISQFLDLGTLVLLFSMMIINANLRLSGFFNLAGSWLVKWARKPRTFLALEVLLVGVLSALFLNDTICLMFTPLILEVTTAARRNPIPYLIALATASNVGSTATLTGNPQNMIIGIASGILYLSFTAALLPVVLLGLGGIWVVLVGFYPYEFTKDAVLTMPEVTVQTTPAMLNKTLLVAAGLLVAFLIGVPVAEASFLAACVLLFTRRTSPQTVFAEFDWSLLVFFSALFILTGSLEANGVTGRLFNLLHVSSSTNVWSLTLVTAVLSNLVSNVPAVLLLKQVAAALQNPQAGWLTLAAASTLAGNLTLLGSVANLIVAETASRRRIELGFWEYTRAGLIITLYTLMISTLWLFYTAWK